jgi:hypothetical protein
MRTILRNAHMLYSFVLSRIFITKLVPTFVDAL